MSEPELSPWAAEYYVCAPVVQQVGCKRRSFYRCRSSHGRGRLARRECRAVSQPGWEGIDDPACGEHIDYRFADAEIGEGLLGGHVLGAFRFRLCSAPGFIRRHTALGGEIAGGQYRSP